MSEIGTTPVDIAVAKVSGENPMEGILELRALADAVPPNLDAVMWLGRFSVQSGQLDKARERFDQVIDAQPDRVEAYWERAMLDMEEGFLEDAVQGFDLCISADEMYVNGRFFKARCLEAMGQVDQALTEYKSYLPLSPTQPCRRAWKASSNGLNLTCQVWALKQHHHAKRKKAQASQDGHAQAEEASSQEPSQEEVICVT